MPGGPLTKPFPVTLGHAHLGEGKSSSSFHKSAIWARDGPDAQELPPSCRESRRRRLSFSPTELQGREAKSEKMKRGKIIILF